MVKLINNKSYVLVCFIHFFTNNTLLFCQKNKLCEINFGQVKNETKDSAYINELSIYSNKKLMFEWNRGGIVTYLDSTQKLIYCLVTDPILNVTDSLSYKEKVLAIINVNTKTCEIKKEILASTLLQKSPEQLHQAYAKYKELYKQKKRIDRRYSNENYLLRYCYDLTYSAIAGDSMSIELLITLNKDFKLSRTGLDAEDLHYNKEMLYDLLIYTKSNLYQERYKKLWKARY